MSATKVRLLSEQECWELESGGLLDLDEDLVTRAAALARWARKAHAVFVDLAKIEDRAPDRECRVAVAQRMYALLAEIEEPTP